MFRIETTSNQCLYHTNKAQRLFRKEVHSSEWKKGTRANSGEDIVSSAWRHVAVHKRTGSALRTLSKTMFDGDQMAVYIPQAMAVSDAANKMWIDTNRRLPSNGEVMFKFKQDMVLGLNILTKWDENDETFIYLEQETTENRINLFRDVVPKKYHNDAEMFARFNIEMDKKSIERLVDQLERIMEPLQWINTIDKMSKHGFKNSHATLSLKDFILEDPVMFDEETVEDNNATRMIRSGARGSWGQYKQIAVEKGYVSDVTGRVLPQSIKSSLLKGLDEHEYFNSCYGGRKGIIDTADNTSKSGYLTRKLVYLLSHIKISANNSNCSIQNSNNKTFEFYVRDEQLASMLIGRFTEDGEITRDNYKDIVNKTIQLYSPITCNEEEGICRRCYGRLFDIHKHRMVGIIAAQSLGERTTQLTLRTKHTSGSTEDRLGDLAEFVELTESGTIIAKEGGSFNISNDMVVFTFNDIEYDFTGYDTLEVLLNDSYYKEDNNEYVFCVGDELANVTLSNKDVVSAVNMLTSALNNPATDENTTIQDFLYKLVDIYGKYATVDLIHYELIVTALCRSVQDISIPFRHNNEGGYKLVGMSKMISMMPEQALAFERFSFYIQKFITGNAKQAKEANFSLLRSMLFFDFDEREVPELVTHIEQNKEAEVVV